MAESVDMTRLSRMIRRIEGDGGRRAGDGESVSVPTGWDAIDDALAIDGRRGLPCGAVHEWLDGDPPEGWLDHPPLCIVQHLVRRACQARASDGRLWSIWIGRGCWPYPWGLAASRCGGGNLLPCTVRVDPPDVAARLWAIDLAARCRAVAAVVADGGGLDIAATRRLQLAARAGRALVLLTRPTREIRELSAAATRWAVRATPSADGRPRWNMQLLRCKIAPRLASDGQGGDSPHTWRLRWDHATGTVCLDADVADRSAASPARSQASA